MYKGPEVGNCLVCPRNSKKVTVVGGRLGGTSRCWGWIGEEVGEMGTISLRRASQVVKTLIFPSK